MTNTRNTLQPVHKGSITEGIFHALEQALLSILISLIAGVIVGIVAAEVIAALLTQKTPDVTTNLISLGVGLLVGYGAAATATIIALVVGLTETVKALAGDIERAGDRVVHELETLAGAADRRGTVEGSVVHHERPASEPVIGVFATPSQSSQRAVEVLTQASAVSQPNSHRNGLPAEELIAPLVPISSSR